VVATLDPAAAAVDEIASTRLFHEDAGFFRRGALLFF
jgi:hypothetical protein